MLRPAPRRRAVTRDPRDVADAASRHAAALERTVDVAAALAPFITNANSRASLDASRLRRVTQRLAQGEIDVAAAWEVAGDAYEDAGDLANAGWARQQAERARGRASELARMRFIMAKTYDTTTPGDEDDDYPETDSGYEFEDTPATADEVWRELRQCGPPFEEVQLHDDLLRIYCYPEEADFRTGAQTRYAFHIRGEPRALRRLEQLVTRGRRRR